jgi:3-hydroxybutyryl-CoA dehydratase
VSCGLIILDDCELPYFSIGRSGREIFSPLPGGRAHVFGLAATEHDRIGAPMQPFYVKPGDQVMFAKTVSETDVYLFAGITGDFSVNHVNEQYMARSKYGRRIAHGALIVGYMSTCSTMMIDQCKGNSLGETPVSLGYDKVRFLEAVFIGDTITLTYNITQVDPQKRQSFADIRVVNQRGDLVAIATHILRWVKDA